MRSASTASVKIALAIGLALLVLAIGLTLLTSPTTVIETNGIPDAGEVARTRLATTACQAGEVVPAETSAVRLTLAGEIGPSVAVALKAGGRTIADGHHAEGWTGASVTIPIQREAHTTAGVEICFALGRPLGSIEIFGEHRSGANVLEGPHGQALPGRMGVEYLRPGRTTWLSLLPTVARHMGLGHAWSGVWIVFALLLAMASAAGLLAWLALAELRLENPR
jgi:hypothetical protein